MQNAVKSWQVEINNKARLQDFKTINPEKFKFFVNGKQCFLMKDLSTGMIRLKLSTNNKVYPKLIPQNLPF